MSARLTKEKFVEQSNTIHNFKYDYSKFVYINAHTKGIIICHIHGEFYQNPNSHKNGYGCPTCGGTKKSSLLEFVNFVDPLHLFKYDYSKFVYVNSSTKGIIICPIHGQFEQSPEKHKQGRGCPFCAGNIKYSIVHFMELANKVHNFQYNYSKFIYVNKNTKGEIICSDHGSFWQTPRNHIKNEQGCPKCAFRVSTPEIEWLNYLNIPENLRNKIKIINGSRYRLDAYDPDTNTIYEFYGDYWHGNPEVFNFDEYNKNVKKTFGELYAQTLEREEKLKKDGFTIISIWENDWNKLKNLKM